MQRGGYPPATSSYPPQGPVPGYPTGGMPPYPPTTAAAGHPASSGTPTIPEVPGNFPELQSKPLDELKQLVEDEEAFFNYFSGLAQVKKIQKDREQLAEEVEAQAKINLGMKPEFDRQRDQLKDVFDQLASVRRMYDERLNQHQESSRRFSTEMIVDNLRVEASKAEEDSENVAEDFLSGKVEVKEFIDKFIAAKMLCHVRRAKEEKLKQSGVHGSW